MDEIIRLFPGEVEFKQRSGRWRGTLIMGGGLGISVVLASLVKEGRRGRTWRVHPVWHEWEMVTLLARLDRGNISFFDFHVLPSVDKRSEFYIHGDSEWLKRGLPLPSLSEFCKVVSEVAGRSGPHKTLVSDSDEP